MNTKYKIIAAIKTNDFAKKCFDKDYAFDIVVDDKKWEVRPFSPMAGYWNGADAYCYETSELIDLGVIDL